MSIQPVPKDYAQNRRDDGWDDFATLKAKGLVRDKEGNVIGIDDSHYEFSAIDRDKLFQAYVVWRKENPSGEGRKKWITDQAAKIIGKRTGRAMSYGRAEKIIGQGCGGWSEPNSMWWRGLSVSQNRSETEHAAICNSPEGYQRSKPMRTWPTKFERVFTPIGAIVTNLLGITLGKATLDYRDSLGPNWFIWTAAAVVIPFTLFFGWVFIRFNEAKRASRRVRMGRCPQCDYPVCKGRLQLGDKCKECGLVVNFEIIENDLRWREIRLLFPLHWLGRGLYRDY